MGFAYSGQEEKLTVDLCCQVREEALFNDTMLVCSHMTPKAYRGVYAT